MDNMKIFGLDESNNLKKLDQKNKCIVEYVWIGGNELDIRSKCKTIDGEVKSINDIPEWNFDGSSTNQAITTDSEVLLRPVKIYNDPFRENPNKIVLCETFTPDNKPTKTNFRHFANKIFEKGIDEYEPHFGAEQEYFMIQKSFGSNISWPYEWPNGRYLRAQGQYYCGNGHTNVIGRDLVNDHYKACLYAGVQIYGINAEVAPSQWEFQIGTSRGIDLADDLWMARFLLVRCGEIHGIEIDFSCKPIKGNWNGTGCHMNYSTKQTSEKGGIKVIHDHLKKLELEHKTSISMYGKGNHERLTGQHESSRIDKFSSGVANRGCSIRIPRTTDKDGCGYYEDRRPAGNIDPYVVTSSLFSITCLDNFGLKELKEHFEKM